MAGKKEWHPATDHSWLHKALTLLAVFGGAVLAGITSFLGNPIPGVLGLFSTFLWDIRDSNKYREIRAHYAKKKHARSKKKHVPEDVQRRPIARGKFVTYGMFIFKTLLFLGVAFSTIIFAMEDAPAVTDVQTNHERFWVGLDDSTVAGRSAIAAGVLSLIYALTSLVTRSLDYFDLRRTAAAQNTNKNVNAN